MAVDVHNGYCQPRLSCVLRCGRCIFEALPPKKKPLVHHSIVYDAARETRQPVRTWVLHAWGALLRQLRHSRDFGKFVQPTLALVDAHLLCDVGSTYTGKCDRVAINRYPWTFEALLYGECAADQATR